MTEHTVITQEESIGLSPGEFEGVVEGRRQQKAVLVSAEGQTSDLFGVDGNILTRFESRSADLLHTEA